MHLLPPAVCLRSWLLLCDARCCLLEQHTDFPPSKPVDGPNPDSSDGMNPYCEFGYRFCQGNCSTVPRPLNEFQNSESRKCTFCCDKKRRSRQRLGGKRSANRAKSSA